LVNGSVELQIRLKGFLGCSHTKSEQVRLYSLQKADFVKSSTFLKHVLGSSTLILKPSSTGVM